MYCLFFCLCLLPPLLLSFSLIYGPLNTHTHRRAHTHTHTHAPTPPPHTHTQACARAHARDKGVESAYAPDVQVPTTIAIPAQTENHSGVRHNCKMYGLCMLTAVQCIAGVNGQDPHGGCAQVVNSEALLGSNPDGCFLEAIPSFFFPRPSWLNLMSETRQIL